jgi:hypothetical protein
VSSRTSCVACCEWEQGRCAAPGAVLVVRHGQQPRIAPLVASMHLSTQPTTAFRAAQPAPGVRSKEKLVELPSELDKGPEDTAVDLSTGSFEVWPPNIRDTEGKPPLWAVVRSQCLFIVVEWSTGSRPGCTVLPGCKRSLHGGRSKGCVTAQLPINSVKQSSEQRRIPAAAAARAGAFPRGAVARPHHYLLHRGDAQSGPAVQEAA